MVVITVIAIIIMVIVFLMYLKHYNVKLSIKAGTKVSND